MPIPFINQRQESYLSNNLQLILVVVFFGIIYLLISLVNHYLFRTYALDLGIYNQALYSLSRFNPAQYTLDISGTDMSLFAAHWSPVIFLYVPFYYLFGEYTLLIIQAFSVLLGGYGIYRVSTMRGLNEQLSLIILVLFYSLWGIYSAISFDFHNNVIAAMAVPWFFYFIGKRRWVLTLLVFILILSAQENMSLWMVFILGGIFISGKSFGRKEVIFFSSLIVVSVTWFIVVNLVAMPSLLPDGMDGPLGRYSHLGDSYFEICKNILIHPAETIRLFYLNTTADPIYSGIKQELLVMILVSGGLVLLVRPAYLVMIIPVYLQKVLSSDYALWGINYHYSIEFAPIIALAVIDALLVLKRDRLRSIVAISLLIMTATATMAVTAKRKSKWYNPQNASIVHRDHFRSDFNRKDLTYGLSMIPKKAIVSVSTELAPHLGFSTKLYHFPVIKDAEYIAVLKTSDKYYPLSKDGYHSAISLLRESGSYKVVYETGDLIIFKGP